MTTIEIDLEPIKRDVLNQLTGHTNLLLLIRGLPGCGKSTLAKSIAIQYFQSINTITHTNDINKMSDDLISEADKYFIDEEGHYEFDSTLLTAAHQWAYEQIEKGMNENKKLLITSNTFTEAWELYTYIAAVSKHKYSLYVIDLNSTSHTDQALANRTIHGVKEGKIKQMRTRYDSTIKTGLWSTEDIHAFLHKHNPHKIKDSFIGIVVDYQLVLGNAALLLPLVQDGFVSVTEFVEAYLTLRKRNGRTHDYHMTVVPPPLRSKLTPEDLAELSVLIDNTTLTVDGAGIVQKGDQKSIYLTVSDACVQPLRAFLAKHTEVTWYPHITVGLIGEDIHDLPKLPYAYGVQGTATSSATAPAAVAVAPITGVPDPRDDTLDLLKCVVHPMVNVKPRHSATLAYTFVDISVVATAGLGDDNTYLKWPELLEMVPRGLVYLQQTPSLWTCVLRGLTKFTGSVGNDDDVDSTHVLNEENISTMIATMFANATYFRRSKKENGRCGLMSLVQQLSPTLYTVCIGTKLAHIFLKYDIKHNLFEMDEAIFNDERSKSIGGGVDFLYRNVLAYQHTLATCDRYALFAYLDLQQRTWITEVLDDQDQHIERLPDGMLKAVGIQITSIPDKTYVPTALDDLRQLRVFVTNLGPREPISLYTTALEEMKRGRTEGYVVIFENDNGHIVGLLKVKCVWYIVCRAIREATKSKLLRGHKKAVAGTDYGKWSKEIHDADVKLKELEKKAAELDLSTAPAFQDNLTEANGDLSDLIPPLSSSPSKPAKRARSSEDQLDVSATDGEPQHPLSDLDTPTAATPATTSETNTAKPQHSKAQKREQQDSKYNLERKKEALTAKLAALHLPGHIDTARKITTTLSHSWAHKFDFLRAEINNYDQIKHSFISTASAFFLWYASEIDKGHYTDDIATFSARFPLIWDRFLAETGHSDDFLGS